MGALRPGVFAIAFAASAAFAQVRETTTVEVVEVPVYVTAHSAPVTNLTRDNFQLFINGKPHSIDYFDVTDYATFVPGEKHDVRQRRLYMLVFDLLSPANALHRAQKAALEFVAKGAANDTIGVATFSASGLQIAVPFTRDRAVTESAIRELQIQVINDPLHLAMTLADRGRVSRGDPVSEARLMDPMVQRAALASDEVAFLTDLADRLAGMEGQKHVVLMSAGFESVILHGVESPGIAPGDPRARGPARLADLDRRERNPVNSQLLWEIDGMHTAYANAGVFLDAIDIGGLRPFQTALSNDSLYTLVHDTGGRVIDRRNNLSQAMDVLTDLSRVVYTIGFNASDTGKSENKITVKLVNVPRGTEVLYRRTYRSGGAQVDTGDMLRLADIIQNDIAQNGVTANVSATPSSKGADVEVQVPGRELLAQASGGFVGAKVMMYVMSGANVVAFKIKRLDIDLSRAEAGLREAPIRVRDTFDLAPGSYAAKVIVRMDATGILGFGRADVVIPSAQ